MNEAPGPRIARLALAWVVLVATGRLQAQESGSTNPPGIGRAASGRDDGGDAASETPDRFYLLFRAINPARFQRLLDKSIGFDPGERSTRPKAPEIGEPVFFDLTRPLGDLKYANELNYLFNSNTRNAPSLQVIEYEYTFADWRSAELDLSYYNGNLEILTPFYQRTLGVGRRRNWVHGYQVSPDFYLRSGFVGGSAVYAFAWKPEEESKFSTLIFAGANRALIGGFQAPTARELLAHPGDRVFGAWRPTVIVDLFYKVGEKLSIGFEADQFLRRGKAGESLDFPFLTYAPNTHAFFQVGGGYYRFESRDQFTFFVHLNFVNRSDRRPRDEEDDRAEAGSDVGADEPGPIRKGLERLLNRR